MMRTAKGIALLVVCVAVGAAHAYPYDPARDWRTLETEHFRVHYDAALEPAARRAAAIAEQVHARVAPLLGWTPTRRTEVVLVDDTDHADGFATPLPRNMMGLYLTPPEPGSFLHVDGIDQWLTTVITHEYTHVIHADKASGWPLRLRSVFGRQLFTFPLVHQPLWLIEGLATHFETDLERGVGRGQEAAAAMVMRAEVAAGMRTLSQANAPNRSWPAGQVPYLYGVSFHQFLEDRHGTDAIRRFIDAYSANLVPFQLSASARAAFGRDMPTLWDEFDRWMFERHGPELTRIRQAGVVDGEPLSRPGVAGRHDGGNVQAMGDGSVYFIEDAGTHRPRLMHLDARGHLARIAALHRGARFSVHESAGIMVAQPERCGEYRVYYDLYLISHGSRRPQRLTRCSRYRDVAWHPDGDTLAAVRYAGGRASLHLISARGAMLQVIAEPDDGGLVAQPHFSPDGRRVVYVRTVPGEGADLYEHTLETGAVRRLTDDRAFPVGPRYTRDGRAVLFSSDHGGIHDLRRLDLATGRIETLTRVETGAFDPSDGPDGVVFLAYGVDGYQLRRLPREAELRLATAAPRRDGERPSPVAVDARNGPSTRYDPVDTLAPTAWAPYLAIGDDLAEFGAFVWGQDTLGIHRYALLPAYDVRRSAVVGSASYGWSDRATVDIARWNDPTATGVVQNDSATVAWRFPHSGLYASVDAHLAAGYDRDRELDGARAAVRDNLVGAAVVFDNAREYRLSVSRQEGRHVRGIVERSVGGSDFAGTTTTLDWREFVHLGGSRVLALRYARARADTRARPFELGGPDSEQYAMVMSDQQGLFNKRRYSLRGYEPHPALVGSDMQLASAEFRFPVRLVERSPWPLGVERWSGAVFVEAGGAASRGDTLHMHRAAGIEALLDLTLGYRFGSLRLRAGYARGFDRAAGGADRLYLDIGSSF